MKSKVLFTVLACIIVFNAKSQWILLDSVTSTDLNKVHTVSDKKVFMIPSYGPLFRTNDGGETWDTITSISVKSNNSYDSDLFFVNDSLGFIATHNNAGELRIFRSSDGGNNWNDISPEKQTFGKPVIQFMNTNLGYLYVNYAFTDLFWITTNGGNDWTEIPLAFSLGTGTSTLPSMFFVNDSTGFLAGGDGTFNYRGAIARTRDRGTNWDTSYLTQINSLVNDIYFPTEDTGYLITREGDIYTTVDQGNAWSRISTVNTTGSLIFTNARTGYVITGSVIYKSSDAGYSWEAENIPAHNGLLTSIDFADEHTGYVVGTIGTVLKTPATLGMGNEALRKSRVLVFPNPAGNNLNLQLNGVPRVHFLLYNATGGLVMDEQVTSPSRTIDLSGLSGGVYWYSISTDDMVQNGRILKH